MRMSLISSFTPPISIPSYPNTFLFRRTTSTWPSSRRFSVAARLQQLLSQRVNPPGIATFADVITNDPQLAIPHLSVPDAGHVDWSHLSRLGFRGVVFDKDNTLTAPYSLSLWPSLSDSFRLCREEFPGRVVVFSNSTGSSQYDPDGMEAKALEEAIGGIHVLRHETKKPAGTAKDIERYFGCSASQLVMVGDRLFTDIVYGNRNGFLTILTQPLSPSEDPFIVKQVRILENYIVNRWYQQGMKPAKHSLVSDIKRCVKASEL